MAAGIFYLAFVTAREVLAWLPPALLLESCARGGKKEIVEDTRA